MALPWLRRLVAGLSPRKPGFDPRPGHMEFLFHRVALRKMFLRVVLFSPVQYNSTHAPYSTSTCCSYQQDKRAKSGNLPKSHAVTEIVEHWEENCLRFQGVTSKTKFNLNFIHSSACIAKNSTSQCEQYIVI